MPYLLLDKNNVVAGISDHEAALYGRKSMLVGDELDGIAVLGKRTGKRTTEGLRLAVVCNWNSQCGISTYSKFLIDALTPHIAEVRIFSEQGDTSGDGPEVVRCWKRGESMMPCIRLMREWKPDFVLVQHEFGIFPFAPYFLQMLNALEDTPYAVVLHSVYEHLDKTIQTSAIKNVIVHTEPGRQMLAKLGHTGDVYVIPHGCFAFEEVQELWNTFQTPYAIVQFGFGFSYKGVDRAIEAVAHLKKTDPKFHNIFYVYLCSQTATPGTQNRYYESLMQKVDELDMRDNVAIIQKFQSEQTINNYLRTAKLALFPYVMDPTNTVYAASGAVRIAMANHIPVIASDSHLFDDLDGIVPRPHDHLSLAKAIDEVFSDESHRRSIVEKSLNYVRENNWDVTARRYLDTMGQIMKKLHVAEAA